MNYECWVICYIVLHMFGKFYIVSFYIFMDMNVLYFYVLSASVQVYDHILYTLLSFQHLSRLTTDLQNFCSTF